MKLDALSNMLTTGASAQAPTRTIAPAQPAQVVEQRSAPPVDSEQVYRAAEAVNRKIQAVAPNLHFSVDDDTGKTVVRVVDTNTGETIRQVPSEELLAISRSIDRLQGLLLDGEG